MSGVIAAMRDALARFDDDAAAAIDALAPLYADDVVFQDPIQITRGRDEFLAMNRRLVARARSLRFVIEDAVEQGDVAFLAWTIHFVPKTGPAMSIPGATHLRLRDGKVVWHRDHWDLVGSVMDALPLAAPAWRAAVALLG